MQAFLNIPSPRYLGPAHTDGAVYVASLQDNRSDVLVFKGNLDSAQVGECLVQSQIWLNITKPDFSHRNFFSIKLWSCGQLWSWSSWFYSRSAGM